MSVSKHVGQTIRSLRKAQGLTQEKLAEKAGLHRTYIGALERGEKSPTVETLARVARALNSTMSDFFFQCESDWSPRV